MEIMRKHEKNNKCRRNTTHCESCTSNQLFSTNNNNNNNQSINQSINQSTQSTTTHNNTRPLFLSPALSLSLSLSLSLPLSRDCKSQNKHINIDNSKPSRHLDNQQSNIDDPQRTPTKNIPRPTNPINIDTVFEDFEKAHSFFETSPRCVVPPGGKLFLACSSRV